MYMQKLNQIHAGPINQSRPGPASWASSLGVLYIWDYNIMEKRATTFCYVCYSCLPVLDVETTPDKASLRQQHETHTCSESLGLWGPSESITNRFFLQVSQFSVFSIFSLSVDSPGLFSLNSGSFNSANVIKMYAIFKDFCNQKNVLGLFKTKSNKTIIAQQWMFFFNTYWEILRYCNKTRKINF